MIAGVSNARKDTENKPQRGRRSQIQDPLGLRASQSFLDKIFSIKFGPKLARFPGPLEGGGSRLAITWTPYRNRSGPLRPNDFPKTLEKGQKWLKNRKKRFKRLTKRLFFTLFRLFVDFSVLVEPQTKTSGNLCSAFYWGVQAREGKTHSSALVLGLQASRTSLHLEAQMLFVLVALKGIDGLYTREQAQNQGQCSSLWMFAFSSNRSLWNLQIVLL